MSITVEPVAGRIEAIVGGEVVGSSTRAVVLREEGAPERWYIPRDDVRMDLLEQTETTYRCSLKGEAEYWSVRVGEALYPDVVWSYPSAPGELQPIAGLLAFWDGQPGVEVLVGAPAPEGQTL